MIRFPTYRLVAVYVLWLVLKLVTTTKAMHGNESSSSQSTVRTHGCYDYKDECILYHLAGLCISNTAVYNSCKFSCGRCSGSCSDNDRNCGEVREKGLCYNEYARKHCRKTCNMCSCKNRYSSSYCQSVNQNGYCYGHSYSRVYRERCIQSCSLCTCEDTGSDCYRKSKAGYCLLDQSYMAKFCRKSCGFCMDECRDLSVECAEWGRFEGCKNNAAKIACPVTCGMCKSEPSPTIAPTHDTETCEDKSEDCPVLARAEKCTIPHIRTMCPLSCHTCVCGDNHRKCSEMAEDGLCKTRPTFMANICKLSCGLCKCEDSDERCKKWAEQGQCTTSDDVITKCQASCNMCKCGDSSITCGSDALTGKCVSNPKYMMKHCALSCNQCSRCDDNPPYAASCAEKKLKGECVSDRSNMVLHCAKTCGFCDDDDDSLDEEEPTAGPTNLSWV